MDHRDPGVPIRLRRDDPLVLVEREGETAPAQRARVELVQRERLADPQGFVVDGFEDLRLEEEVDHRLLGQGHAQLLGDDDGILHSEGVARAMLF